MRSPRHALTLLLIATSAGAATPAAQSSAWVDRVTEKWNAAGAGLPAPPASQEARPALVKRCAPFVVTEGAAAAALAKAGWTPFLHLDKQITRDDIEVVGGMAAATPDCQPAMFNLFVFVGGRFAGTLSPAPMSAAQDGAAGPVRLAGTDSILAEFSRYKPSDSACCPSSVARVTYRINRAGAAPVLEATETRRVR
jgi:hypothetical protein